MTTPAPKGPTDEEIMELMPQQMHDDLAAAARALAEQAGTDNRRAMGVMRIILNRHAVDHVRAALVKWGTPTPQPVPISERLPVLGDCDEQGWVWAWRVYDAQDDDSGEYWMQIPYGWLPHYLRWSHWLPTHALPTPEAKP